MFKYVIVVLAVIAAVFAAPRPQIFYTSPTAYSPYNTYAAPAAASVYSSGGYIPAAYSAYAPAPAAYSGYAPFAYL